MYIFVKKVADTAINRSCVKVDINNIGNEEYILELKISDSISEQILEYNKANSENNKLKSSKKIKTIFRELLRKSHIKKFYKCLQKNIINNELMDYFVIFSNNIPDYVRECIQTVLKRFNIREYFCENTFKSNIWKYIEEYENKNNFTDADIIPVLFINNINNFDFQMLEDMNSRYKNISIHVKQGVNDIFENKIKRINEECGSCIDLILKSKKDFRRYNACVFLDSPKETYLNYMFSKNICCIDVTNKENDRYNKKYLKLKKNINDGKYYTNKIKEICELYGKVTVSNVLDC